MSVISASLTPYDSHILDLAYDGIFLLALDGTILFWNRGAEDMYGCSRQQAVQKISHRLLRAPRPRPLSGTMEELRARGQWQGEPLHTARDARELIVSARWALDRDAHGRPHG